MLKIEGARCSCLCRQLSDVQSCILCKQTCSRKKFCFFSRTGVRRSIIHFDRIKIYLTNESRSNFKHTFSKCFRTFIYRKICREDCRKTNARTKTNSSLISAMHMLIFGSILFLSVVIARPLTDAFYYTKTIDFLRRAAASPRQPLWQLKLRTPFCFVVNVDEILVICSLYFTTTINCTSVGSRSAK